MEQRNRQIDELREHLAHFEDLASANSYDSAVRSPCCGDSKMTGVS